MPPVAGLIWGGGIAVPDRRKKDAERLLQAERSDGVHP